MGLPLSCRQESAGYWTGGMNDGIEMRVIVIVNMRRNAIQQSSVLRISKEGTLVAEDGCCGRAKEGAQGFVLYITWISHRLLLSSKWDPKSITYSNLHCFMITAAYCAAGPVVEAPD